MAFSFYQLPSADSNVLNVFSESNWLIFKQFQYLLIGQAALAFEELLNLSFLQAQMLFIYRFLLQLFVSLWINNQSAFCFNFECMCPSLIYLVLQNKVGQAIINTLYKFSNNLSKFHAQPCNKSMIIDYIQIIQVLNMGSAVATKQIDTPLPLQLKYKLTQPNFQQHNQTKSQVPSIPQTFLRKYSGVLSNVESCELLLRGSKSDRRTPRDKDQMNKFPFNCTGVLSYQFISNQQLKAQCSTGLLIGPRLILGCAHFLSKFKQRGAKEIRFETKGSIFSIDKFLFPQQYVHTSLIQYDFCLFTLQKYIKLDKYITLCVDFNLRYFPALIIGFSEQNKQNSNNKLQQNSLLSNENQIAEEYYQSYTFSSHKLFAYSMKGLIEQNTPKYLQYDIDTINGMSGSGILVQLYKNYFISIGVHSGFYKSSINQNGQKIKTLSQSIESENDDFNSGCKLGQFFLNQLEIFCRDNAILLPQVFDFSKVPDFLSQKYYSLSNPANENKSSRNQSSSRVNSSVQPQLQTGVFKPNIPQYLRRMPSMIIEQQDSLKGIQQTFKNSQYRKCILLCQKQLNLNFSRKNLLEKAKICYFLGQSYRKNQQQSLASPYLQICCKILKKVYKQHQKSQLSQIIHQNVLPLSILMKAANSHQNKQHRGVILSVLTTSRQIKQELANVYLAHGIMETSEQKCRQSLDLFNDCSQNMQQYFGNKLLSLSFLLGSLMKSKKYSQWVEVAAKNIEIIHTAKRQSGLQIKIDSPDRRRQQINQQLSIQSIDLQPQQQVMHERISWKKDQTKKEQIFKTYFQNWVIDILQGLNSLSIESIKKKDWVLMAFIISQITKGVLNPQSRLVTQKIQFYTSKIGR